jgi:hypothetical protein
MVAVGAVHLLLQFVDEDLKRRLGVMLGGGARRKTLSIAFAVPSPRASATSYPRLRISCAGGGNLTATPPAMEARSSIRDSGRGHPEVDGAESGIGPILATRRKVGGTLPAELFPESRFSGAVQPLAVPSAYGASEIYQQ